MKPRPHSVRHSAGAFWGRSGGPGGFEGRWCGRGFGSSEPREDRSDAPEVHGKEGVIGSSPMEGLALQSGIPLLVVCFAARRGHKSDTNFLAGTANLGLGRDPLSSFELLEDVSVGVQGMVGACPAWRATSTMLAPSRIRRLTNEWRRSYGRAPVPGRRRARSAGIRAGASCASRCRPTLLRAGAEGPARDRRDGCSRVATQLGRPSPAEKADRAPPSSLLRLDDQGSIPDIAPGKAERLAGT